jgi:hypothetical protein
VRTSSRRSRIRPSSCKFKRANVEHNADTVNRDYHSYRANSTVNVHFASQTASVTQANIPVTVQIKDVTINPKITVNESTNIIGNTNNAGNIGPSVPPTAETNDSTPI